MNKQVIIIAIIFIPIMFSGCRQVNDEPAGSEGWLKGDVQQKFETIAGQLGGFGRIMWEVDYRFQELYWAGQDMNWEYALHHVLEIEETLEDGLERRPARAGSARQFLTSALPEVEKAIESGDQELFEKRFQVLMSTCNSCHVLEEMPFITVNLPLARRSSIR
jgi:hypothetical protein